MSDHASSAGPAAHAPSPPLPRLLDLAEVAALTDLSVSTLRRQIRLRKLAVIRVGSALRVAADDLAEFVRRHRRAAR